MKATGAERYTAAQKGGEREMEDRSLLVQEKYWVVVTESDNYLYIRQRRVESTVLDE